MSRKRGGKEGGKGGSGAQKRGPALSPPDAVGANKKTSRRVVPWELHASHTLFKIMTVLLQEGKKKFHNAAHNTKSRSIAAFACVE
jgi:hypothetical protein